MLQADTDTFNIPVKDLMGKWHQVHSTFRLVTSSHLSLRRTSIFFGSSGQPELKYDIEA